jgi:hypothetical protein
MTSFQPVIATQSTPDAGNRLAATVIVLLFMVAALLAALRKDITQGFDEVAHVSYVAELQHHRALLLPLEQLRLLDSTTFRFTPQASYLNHPSPYYALLAWLGPTLEDHPRTVIVHRLFNMILVAVGLAIALAIGLAARVPRLDFYAYAVPLACIPVLPALAGSVNNDNLAISGGAIATFGAYNLLTDRRSVWLAVALIGLTMAAAAKLTGLLLVGAMLGIVFVQLLLTGRFRWSWAIPIALTFALATSPYLVLTLQYGEPVPNTPGYLEMLASDVPGARLPNDERLGFAAYVIHFLTTFVVGWMPSLAPRTTLNYVMLAIPVATLVCALAGVICSVRRVLRGDATALDIVLLGGGGATAATFALHVAYSYQRHVATGWLLDAYPRYYLPLAVIVPIATLSLLAAVHQPRLRAAVLGLFILGPIAFWALGAPLA